MESFADWLEGSCNQTASQTQERQALCSEKKDLDANLDLSSDSRGEFIRATAQFQVLIQAPERFGSRDSGGENQNGQSA
jgi:hypothetical protein